MNHSEWFILGPQERISDLGSTNISMQSDSKSLNMLINQ